MKEKILFVCYGNTCRSPMCAALYNAKYAQNGSYAASAGLSVTDDNISARAISALRAYGIAPTDGNDYVNHVPTQVTEQLVRDADRIVCVSPMHAVTLKKQFPSFAEKIVAFSQPIFDPYGGDEGLYRFCLTQIDKQLDKMFANHDA